MFTAAGKRSVSSLPVVYIGLNYDDKETASEATFLPAGMC